MPIATMSDANIRQLTEMGFSTEAAHAALRKANNDLGAAIGILFGEEQPSTDPPDYALKPLTGESAAPPPPLRPLPPLPPAAAVPIDSLISDHLQLHARQRLSSRRRLSSPAVSLASDGLVFDHESKFVREEFLPPVLVPGLGGWSGMMASIVTILHQVPAFRAAVYLLKGYNQAYDPAWFRPTALLPGFTAPLQRCMALLDQATPRWFASTRPLEQLFYDRPALVDALLSEEAAEVLLQGLEKLLAKHTQGLLTLVVAEYLDDTQQEANAVFIKLEDDEIRCTLYQLFHSLLWDGDDHDVAVQLLAPVLVVPLVTGSKPIATGLQAAEQFFPQVFTREYAPRVETWELERRKLKQRVAELLLEIHHLGRFNGASASEFVPSALDFLEKEAARLDGTRKTELEQASAALRRAHEELSAKKQQLHRERVELKDQLLVYEQCDYAQLLGRGDVPRPYLLTGVCVDVHHMYYLWNSSDPAWIAVEYSAGGDFHLSSTDFDLVQAHVQELTQQPHTDVILFYVEQSVWQAAAPEVPAGLVEFGRRDGEEMARALQPASTSADAPESLV